MFGNKAFKEVMKLKRGHQSETLMLCEWRPHKKGDLPTQRATRDIHAQRTALWGHREKGASASQGESPQKDPPCGHFDLGLQPPELWAWLCSSRPSVVPADLPAGRVKAQPCGKSMWQL